MTICPITDPAMRAASEAMLGHTQSAPLAYSRKPSRLILTPHNYPLAARPFTGVPQCGQPAAHPAGGGAPVKGKHGRPTTAGVNRRVMGCFISGCAGVPTWSGRGVVGARWLPPHGPE